MNEFILFTYGNVRTGRIEIASVPKQITIEKTIEKFLQNQNNPDTYAELVQSDNDQTLPPVYYVRDWLNTVSHVVQLMDSNTVPQHTPQFYTIALHLQIAQTLNNSK